MDRIQYRFLQRSVIGIVIIFYRCSPHKSSNFRDRTDTWSFFKQNKNKNICYLSKGYRSTIVINVFTRTFTEDIETF